MLWNRSCPAVSQKSANSEIPIPYFKTNDEDFLKILCEYKMPCGVTVGGENTAEYTPTATVLFSTVAVCL